MREIKIPVYEVAAQGGSFLVLRNQRSLMTPEGKPYVLPSVDLAQAVADEWTAQGGKINTATMPLTQLSATALDIVSKTRAQSVEGLISFLRSELLCHRAERPQALVDRQEKMWQPILDWCAAHYGIRFTLTCGVMPASQKEETDQLLRTALESYDDFWLTGLRQAAETAGSLVLGLAMIENHLTASEVFDASELDVMHQNRAWGEDPVTLARQKSVRFDLEAVEKWFSFLRG